MPEDRPDRPARSGQTEDPPPYRVYRAGRESPQSDPDRRGSSDPYELSDPDERRPNERRRPDQPARPDRGNRPYTLYRSAPRGLMQRLRGEDGPAVIDRPAGGGGRDGGRGGGGPGAGGRQRSGNDGAEPGKVRWWRKRWTPFRILRWVVGVCVFWLVLSLVLFLISASIQSGGSIPASAKRQLSSGSNMITGTDTVLVLGLDQRPKGSKEPGAFAGGIRSDSMMLWRIGGGTSRRLSIPRDTWVNIPGHGQSKINAAYAYGGPALAIKTVEQFTHVKINHVIIVNLANFPVFIDAIGGVDIKTGRICSKISGGAKNGGFSLFLKPGEHHLSGIQALTLARTRENSCNAASNDLTREAYQQQILNDIKSKLVSPAIIPRLPWASWDAPKALRTDMGGFTRMQLFVAAEIGGSAPTDILKPTGSSVIDGQDALVATSADVRRHVRKLMTGH
jgi:LCP family protein required for cell wall assembly